MADGGLSAELRLLLALVAADPARSPHGSALAGAARIDWDGFAALVTRHRVGGLVLHGLARTPGLVPPPDLQAELARTETRNAHMLLGAVRTAHRITSACAGQGIACAVLKGFPLAQRYYAVPSARSMIDLDLLVAPERIEDADAIALAAGFARYTPAHAPSAVQRASLEVLHNAAAFINPATGMQLDLHWRTTQFSGLLPEIDRTWQASVVSDDGAGLAVPVLRPAVHFVYVMVHGAKHGWARLKWLVDLDRMLAGLTPSELAEASGLIERGGLERLAASSLALAHDLLGSPVPAPLAALLQTEASDALQHGARQMIVGEPPIHTKRLRDLPGILGRLRYTLGLRSGGGYRGQVLLASVARYQDLVRFPLPPRWLWLLALLSPLTALAERLGLARKA